MRCRLGSCGGEVDFRLIPARHEIQRSKKPVRRVPPKLDRPEKKILTARQRLEQEVAAGLVRIRQSFDPSRAERDAFERKPRRSDVVVDAVAVLWVLGEPADVLSHSVSRT